MNMKKLFFQNFVNLNIKSIDEINQKIPNINDLYFTTDKKLKLILLSVMELQF